MARVITRFTAPSWQQDTFAGDGSTTGFTLSHTPKANATVVLLKDDVPMVQGTDYTISATSITMTIAPAEGQQLFAYYLIA